MKRLIAVAITLVMSLCLLPSLSIAFADAEPRSLLLEQSSSGAWVYSDGKLTMTESSWDMYELNTELKGMYKYLASDGSSHSFGELDLSIEMKISVAGTDAHCVPTVYFAESDTSTTCVQQRANGALYVIEYYNVGGEKADKFTGVELSSGSEYKLKIDYKHGVVDVYVNGERVAENHAVNGYPRIKLATNTGKGAFSEFVVTTTSDVERFTKEFPDVAEKNENLLDLPGFANKLSSTDVTNNGETFVITKSNLNKNVIVTNDFLSSFRFYRPDVQEYSDGTDMDWLLETTIAFGDYYGSEGWYGAGLIIGETDKGYVRLRAMQAGYLILGDVAKDTGYDLDNFSYSFAHGTSGAKGSEVKIKVYYVDNVVTVFVNDAKALSQEINMTLKLGVHAIYNQATLKNTSFRFIQSVAHAEIEAESEETALFKFSRGKIKGDKADSAISGDINSFNVSLKNSENYFVMNSAGADQSNLYRMTGYESYEVVKQNSLSTLASLTLKNMNISDDGDIVIVFRHNATGKDRTLLRIKKDGTATVETGSASLNLLATAQLSLNAESELNLTIVVDKEKATIKINDEYVFKNISIPEIANALAFGGKNSEYAVSGLSYRYIEDIRFEEPKKEQFNPIEWTGEANTDYIAPPLPQKLPGSGNSASSGCGSSVGCSGIALLSLLATAVVVVKKRK